MAKGRKAVNWDEIELYCLVHPDLSYRGAAKRLGVGESALMARAARGQWTAKRAAAKGAIGTLLLGANGKAIVPATPDSPDTGGNRGNTEETGKEGNPGNMSEICIPNGSEGRNRPEHYLFPSEMGDEAAAVQSRRAEAFTKEMAAQASRLPGIMAQLSDTQLLLNADKIAKLAAVSRAALGVDTETNRAPLVQIQLLGNIGRESVPKVIQSVVSASESGDSGRVLNPA